MEKELNIAAILKDKPAGTKLWSPAIGKCNLFDTTDYTEPIQVITDNRAHFFFENDGRYIKEGDVCLFPSKQMQDWSKFAWKKGDVLICVFCNLCIFDKWCNEEYTEFDAKFVSPDYGGAVLKTHNWSKVLNESTKKRHIAKIEGINGGKLNLETLEIEQPKPEFKDGDILHCDETDYSVENIFIAKMHGEAIGSYAFLCLHNNKLHIADCDCDESELPAIRLATDSEKQQLFSALAKEGKRWNPDTKQIEDLPKKCEFKPMDWCLMKDSTKYWELCQFAYTRKVHDTTIYSAVGGLIYYKCIPYNEETKHLLGTTDDWKGGNDGQK